ncbi:CHASE2 domain-containing protein [Xenophilus aerolatus]|nr:adenylate/guanylate cyclase domain-containing protein [Xenophilus aerolatus]
MQRLTRPLRRHGLRIAVTLLPVLLALAHAAGVVRLPFLDRFDALIYDARLRATMPGTLDPRIVIVDIDDASLQEVGQWPWSRDRLARLTGELVDRQRASVLGFDVMFAEPDRHSGAASPRVPSAERSAAGPGDGAATGRLATAPDHDAAFARSLAGRNVVLGFYFTQSAQPRARGSLPPPVLPPAAFPSARRYATAWNSYGASIPALAAVAPAGFLNVLIDPDADGVVRSVPLIARYEPAEGADPASAGYYESLSLAVFRRATGASAPYPRLAEAPGAAGPVLEALVMGRADGPLAVPVDQQAAALVAFRGPGGVRGGSFRYIPAIDVLDGRLAPGELAGKIVLVGASAPGLQDLRATPVSATYPGVEVHANVISGLLDRRFLAVPDYAAGYDFTVILLLGGILAIGLSLLGPVRAALLALACMLVPVGTNHLLFQHHGLVMPQAACVLMVAAAFVLNMGWGYFVEARTRRGLARLFGTYVPPQLVSEMVLDPHRYTMRAESKELTVMFCDMRGFTRLSEQMAPAALQAFLNEVFSRLTDIINQHRGTVDKYMGDCVMAFWGAPVDTPEHASLAVRAAMEMSAAVDDINATHRLRGLPALSVGIGLNTGTMSVGDMGSTHRRSYTVIGDAVNLAARLEGLGEHYGIDIVASEATRHQCDAFLWQEVDRVRVKGKQQEVTIFTPCGLRASAPRQRLEELAQWQAVLDAYRARRWHATEALLDALRGGHEEKVLYRVYAQRLASIRLQPPDTDWDGAVQFERK